MRKFLSVSLFTRKFHLLLSHSPHMSKNTYDSNHQAYPTHAHGAQSMPVVLKAAATWGRAVTEQIISNHMPASDRPCRPSKAAQPYGVFCRLLLAGRCTASPDCLDLHCGLCLLGDGSVHPDFQCCAVQGPVVVCIMIAICSSSSSQSLTYSGVMSSRRPR
jgi:hypothetical protein